MIGDDFTGSALIGHLIAHGLMATLVGKGIITGAEASAVADGALLQLEEHQADFPEKSAAFDEARDFLDGLAQGYRTIG
jgi:hypothetical protein